MVGHTPTHLIVHAPFGEADLVSGATIAGTARFCHYSRRNCRCTGLRLRPALDGGGRRQRLGGAGSAMTLPLSRDPLPSGSFFAVEHPQVALACPGCPHDPVPLRCHLLIGPPASGKTTLARDLAPLLRSEFGEHALELSTDAIRAELFGDAAVQGPWDEIRSVMLQRLQEAALLSADQLLEVHDLLKASMERLSDASQKPLLLKLEERLRRTGLLDGSAPRRPHSRRALARRAFTEERSGTLASREQSERIERAIRERRRVWLRHLPDLPKGGKGQPTGNDRFRAWPLQLLFHNISWYLAFEFDAIGTEQGLIRALRVDRLQLLGNDGGVRRHKESDHDRALERLERLLDVCGGLWFGNDLEGQLALMPARKAGSADGPEGNRTSSGSDWLDTLRFSCTPRVFSLIREEPNRYPPEHTAYARPIANVSSWPAGPLDRLEPNAANDSHLYPVELRLPRWTVAEDWDLRSWLFRWGNGVRIEQPLALREQHLEQSQGVVELYTGSRRPQPAASDPIQPLK